MLIIGSLSIATVISKDFSSDLLVDHRLCPTKIISYCVPFCNLVYLSLSEERFVRCLSSVSTTFRLPFLSTRTITCVENKRVNLPKNEVSVHFILILIITYYQFYNSNTLYPYPKLDYHSCVFDSE